MALKVFTEYTNDPRAQLLTITPLMAEAWLSKNDGNRNVRAGVVSRYARDMANGRWLVTGEAIKFDPSGRLIDGQHRLRAVIESSSTIRSWVMWDVDPRSFVPMDTGAGRSAADVLKLVGEEPTYVVDLAATATTLIRYEQTGSMRNSGSTQPTRAEVLAYVETHPGLIESVRFIKNSSNRIPGLRVSIGAALHYLFETTDPTDNAAFWSSLKSGASLSERSPILLLRNRLHDNATAKRKFAAVEEAALTIKAWNAWRDGREMSMLIWRPGGATPEKFPEIK